MKKAYELKTGDKFGFFTVVEKSNRKTSSGGIYWIVECCCGQVRDITRWDLVNLVRNSCGCKKKTGKEHGRWKGFGDISSKHWHSAKGGAKRRGISFEISIQDAWEVFKNQNGKCALTGEAIKFSSSIKDSKNNPTTASLDRIDSSKGYTRENIQWLHKRINELKWDNSNKELIDLCRKVVNYNEKST